jgi:signal transduction histidine kinase
MRDILFISEILASVTHDMQNIMAIIKESGALAGDVLALNGPPRMKHGDKLNDSLKNIGEQVRRGRDLMLMLNGFAHAAEDYPQVCDLERYAEQIWVLAARKARMKDCRFTRTPYGHPLPVRGNALRVMHALYLGFGAALADCDRGGEVSLALRSNGQTAALFTAGHERTPACGEHLERIMREMEGAAHAGPGTLELRFAPALAAETVT